MSKAFAALDLPEITTPDEVMKVTKFYKKLQRKLQNDRA